jgi:hypothetical protein
MKIIQFPKFLRKSSPVFKHFLQFDEVHYGGPLNGKIMVFSTQEQSQKGEMLMMSLIRKDEAELWQAFRGLIMDILASIEPKLVGIFRFQLISIAMSEDLEKFQWKEFSQGMRDLAREIPVGESRFVQYCSLLGVLTKHAYEDEGRIQFDSHVQILDEEPEDLDAPLERLIKLDRKGAALSGKRKFVFYDLSRRPLYDPQNSTQGQRLQKLSRKLDTVDSTSLSEVFVIDHNGCHSLFAKSQMEMELF